MTDQNSATILVSDPGESPDALPVCLPPWLENPYRPVSLWYMLQIHARRFITLLDDVGRLQIQCTKGTALNNPEVFGSVLSAVRQDCQLLELISASKQIETIRDVGAEWIKGTVPTWAHLANLVAELQTRIEEDLEEAVFLQVLPEKVRHCFKRVRQNGITEFSLKTPEDFFGAEVVEKFRSSAKDIEEAEKCYSRGCHTACVFHLLRVLEIGVRALGKSLGNPALDPKKNPTWESILRKCDEELQKPWAERCAEWRSDPTFFTEATANLRAVKDAWRNPTMHVECDYDSEQAWKVLGAMRAFMQQLATRLYE